jgi:hypothetical protein
VTTTKRCGASIEKAMLQVRMYPTSLLWTLPCAGYERQPVRITTRDCGETGGRRWKSCHCCTKEGTIKELTAPGIAASSSRAGCAWTSDPDRRRLIRCSICSFVVAFRQCCSQCCACLAAQRHLPCLLPPHCARAGACRSQPLLSLQKESNTELTCIYAQPFP